MKALLIATAVAVAASLTGSARAAAPEPVSIQIHPTVFFPVEIGTWHASGAIADSGSYVRTDAHATGSLPDCFCPLDHPGALQETFVLTGSAGTLTISAEEVATPNGEPGGQVNGVWQIRSGTGGYASVSGHGTDFFGPPLTLYLTGVMSKAG